MGSDSQNLGARVATKYLRLILPLIYNLTYRRTLTVLFLERTSHNSLTPSSPNLLEARLKGGGGGGGGGGESTIFTVTSLAHCHHGYLTFLFPATITIAASLVPRPTFFAGRWKSEGPAVACACTPSPQLRGFTILSGTSVHKS